MVQGEKCCCQRKRRKGRGCGGFNIQNNIFISANLQICKSANCACVPQTSLLRPFLFTTSLISCGFVRSRAKLTHGLQISARRCAVMDPITAQFEPYPSRRMDTQCLSDPFFPFAMIEATSYKLSRQATEFRVLSRFALFLNYLPSLNHDFLAPSSC